MGPLLAILNVFDLVMRPILRLGRHLAWIAIGVMTLIILAQVVFRYVIGDALNWSDEAARFLMLWMTAFIAPSAYRWGGFVSIDMVSDLMPKRAAALLVLILLCVAMLVLVSGIQFGWKHVNSGWLFNSSSLRVPLDLVGGESVRVKLAWMYMSMLVCVIGLAVVNVELMIKALVRLIDPEAEVPQDPDAGFIGAE